MYVRNELALALSNHFPITHTEASEYLALGFSYEVCRGICQLRSLGLSHKQVLAAAKAMALTKR